MENYESPTIEQAGGAGNEIEPNINIPVAITDALLVAVAFTNAAMAVFPILSAVPFKTANFNN